MSRALKSVRRRPVERCEWCGYPERRHAYLLSGWRCPPDNGRGMSANAEAVMCGIRERLLRERENEVAAAFGLLLGSRLLDGYPERLKHVTRGRRA